MDYKRLTSEEKWEKANLSNGFIFYKIFKNNPELCKELIETLLEIKVEKIDIRAEETMFIDPSSKGIRLDINARDETSVFNVEMQRKDTRELPERARYYQGVLDVDSLKPGKEYSEMKDSYVIFICLSDIFGKGLPVYKFQELCVQDTEIKLNDRSYKYFFIVPECDKLLNEKQRALFHLILNNECEDSFTKRLKKEIDLAKTNIQWRKQYMDFDRELSYRYSAGLEDGIQQGIAQGIEQGKLAEKMNNAINFYKSNVSPEIIEKCTGVKLEEILKVINEESASLGTK